MESLQNWGLMGGISINSGFYWGSNTGDCCAILEGEGSRRLGCGLPIGPRRHRRKSRCRDRNLNKQLFAQIYALPAMGEGDGRGQMRLRLLWERIWCGQYGTMLQHRSYPAPRDRGSSRGKLSPWTVFWFLLYAQKERLRGERCLLCLCKRLRDADRRDEIITFCRQPLSHGYAVPAPLTQGSLWVCRQVR